jgi:ABC-type Mn2+/Zn2+ transport system ATPase subunit
LARDLEQVFRLASVPAEHKMTKTQVKFEKIIIIAGPNGAGKTTFARDFLPK